MSITFNFLRALNFFKQSTVSCLWTMDATRSRCYVGKERVALDEVSIYGREETMEAA
jgi:hypothetical protein